MCKKEKKTSGCLPVKIAHTSLLHTSACGVLCQESALRVWVWKPLIPSSVPPSLQLCWRGVLRYLNAGTPNRGLALWSRQLHGWGCPGLASFLLVFWSSRISPILSPAQPESFRRGLSQGTGKNKPSVILIRALELLEREGEIPAGFPHGFVSGWSLGLMFRWVLQAENLEIETMLSWDPMARLLHYLRWCWCTWLSVHPAHLGYLCYIPRSSSLSFLGSAVAAARASQRSTAPFWLVKESDPTASMGSSPKTSHVTLGPCCNSETGDEYNTSHSVLCHRRRRNS